MIPEFFENRDIFITGGSGVVGKALIEMLLRNCNVNKIFILLRSKKDMDCEERLEKMKGELIFRKLKSIKPDVLDLKLAAVPGEIGEPFLGISSKYSDLLQNVSVVYHCAATVKFDEPLKYALKLNVGGTMEALKFSETLKNLQIFMYVSTFYSNPYLSFVDAKIYDAPMDWKFCLDLIERPDYDSFGLDFITRKLIIGFPNTYCFTKNLAEAMVNDYRHRIPLAIYRPSIVTFSVKDPEPGFSHTMMGAMGVNLVANAGLLKVLYQKDDVKLDLTLQDTGVKVLLYQTVKSANLYRNGTDKELRALKEQAPVSICSSCTHCNATLGDFVEIPDRYNFYEKAPFAKAFLLPGVVSTDIRAIYMAKFFFKQLLPALIVDLLLVICCQKPALLRLQRKIFNSLEVMKPFMFNQYYSSGITDVKDISTDMKNTAFDIGEIDEANDNFAIVAWSLHMFYRMREVLMKEDPKTIPKSRMIFKIKTWAYKFILVVLGLKLYHIAKLYLMDFWGTETVQEIN